MLFLLIKLNKLVIKSFNHRFKTMHIIDLIPDLKSIEIDRRRFVNPSYDASKRVTPERPRASFHDLVPIP